MCTQFIYIVFVSALCSDDWPLGTYTVPKPKSGCPNSKKHTWEEAWRFQDLENNVTQGSKFSSNFHMDAKITNNDITRGFCTSFNENVQEPWPRGKQGYNLSAEKSLKTFLARSSMRSCML